MQMYSMGCATAFIYITYFVLTCNLVLAIVSRNGKMSFDYDDDDSFNIGVGETEEVPISSLTLKFAEPSVKVQRSLVQSSRPTAVSSQQEYQEYEDEPQNVDYDELEEEYTTEEINMNGSPGEGSVESIPIDSMRVKFDPVIRFGHPIHEEQHHIDDDKKSHLHCERRCVLPSMPDVMVTAAQLCNVQLIYNQHNFPTLQDNVTREGRIPDTESSRRLDTSLRTACGSKCVLEELNLMQESGIPDVDRVTGFLLESAGHSWVLALREANSICSQDVIAASKFQFGYSNRMSEKQKCQVSRVFMKCIRLQLIKNCPDESYREDCHNLEEEN